MDSDGPLYIDESEDRAAKIFKPSSDDQSNSTTQSAKSLSSSAVTSSVADVESTSDQDTASSVSRPPSRTSHEQITNPPTPSDKTSSSHETSLPSTSSSTGDFWEKDIKPLVGFGLIRDHFTCGICHGILVDAFTIVECLHSFCRSCLIHNTYASGSCPTCGYQLDHVTPFKEIKCDRKVQDLVNAVFPDVRDRERAARVAFYWGLGVPPYVDKVYVDSSALNNSQPPPGALKTATADSYDCSRVNRLHTRSNKVWFRTTAVADTSKPNHFSKLLKRFHDNHKYISCPCYIRVGALIVALEKKLKSLSSLTTKFNLALFYKDEKLSPQSSIKDVYFVHHKYGKFPIDITLSIKPVFRGVVSPKSTETSEPSSAPTDSVPVNTKAVASFCQKISADGELEHSEGNLFANLGLSNGSSKSSSPEEKPVAQKRSLLPEKSSGDKPKKKKGSKRVKNCATPDEAPLFAADPVKITTRVQDSKKTCPTSKDASSKQSKSASVDVKKEPDDRSGLSGMSPDWKVKEEILSKYLVVVADPIDAEVFEKEKKKCKKLNEKLHRKQP